MQSESSARAQKQGSSVVANGDAPGIFPVTIRAVAPLDAALEAYSKLGIPAHCLHFGLDSGFALGPASLIKNEAAHAQPGQTEPGRAWPGPR